MDSKALSVFEAGVTEVEGIVDSKSRYGQFREPGIIKTNSGRLVIVIQARDHSKWSDRSGQDLVVRYSDDNGNTWSPTKLAVAHDNFSICPQACVYDSITNEIHILYNVHEWDFKIGIKGFKDLKKSGKIKGDNSRQFHISSKDGGENWSSPRDISSTIKSDKSVTVFGSGRGIQLKHGPHRGRLIIPGGIRVPKWGNVAFISDDHGENWRIGQAAPRAKGVKGVRNECKIAEMLDGTLMLNCRTMPYRTVAYSKDGGESWSELSYEKNQPMASCNAALISHQEDNKNYMVFAAHAGPGRKNGMVMLSEDGGKSWPHRRIIAVDTVAYPSLCTMSDGRIALVYESEVYHGGSYKDLKLIRFSIGDIFGHTDDFPSDKKDPNAGTYKNN